MNNNRKTIAFHGNGEIIADAYNFDPDNTYNPNVSSSVDPFSGKTNKYAESATVLIVALVKDVCVRWSSDGTAATTTDLPCPAGQITRLVVPEGKPYLRLIERAASAACWVIEE